MAKVFIGMSGGVDSSVAAALLVEQGHTVTGVYMKNWTQDLPGMKCPWADDLADAKRVAVQLGIDFVVFDFETEYRDKVVQYMIDEYKAGRTPNPDIMCNQEVKFRLFLDTALAQGADYIATGHYARVENGAATVAPSAVVSRHREPSETSLHSAELAVLKQSSSGQEAPEDSPGLNEALVATAAAPAPARLLRAHDENKDQTYFLYRVTEEALAHTLFPLGGYLKTEVRELAKARGLWTAAKKESMGVCFVGAVGMREFLGQYVSTQPGDIIDRQSGKALGRHDGAIFYTLGQRHGLELGGGLPYYVVGKDMDKNEVYVSTKLDDAAMWQQDIELLAPHWINAQPAEGATVAVRIRHRAPLIPARLSYTAHGAMLQMAEAQRAVTPGQSVVLYDGEVCVGGGIVA